MGYTIPESMDAFILKGHGSMDMLHYEKKQTPKPEASQALIKVHACGLNNTDINTRTGWYSASVKEATPNEESTLQADKKDASWSGIPLQFPRIQGADICGEVVAVGQKADPNLIGSRVVVDPWLRDWDDPNNVAKTGYIGSEKDGGFAEYVCADFRNVHKVNNSWSSIELATIATSYVTALQMLTLAQLDKHDCVLITGASGGVGSALIQLARLKGAQTIALTSSAHQSTVVELGCDASILRDEQDIQTQLKDQGYADKVSIVADVVGGTIWPDLIKAMAPRGRYVCSGAIAGPIVDFDLRVLYLKCLSFLGASVTEPDTFSRLVSILNNEQIRPLLAQSYRLFDLKKAQQRFLKKDFIGNLVVYTDSCPKN